MKKLFIALLCFSATGVLAQTYNQEIKMEDGRNFLLGQINTDGLQQGDYAGWFVPNYNNYEVDRSLVKLIGPKLQGLQIKLFLGTWCGDSKRQVPRFLKFLNEAGFDTASLEMVALDRRKGAYKKSPTGEERGLGIIKVPTIILFKDGKEINRIVERPIASLEEDLLAIVSGSAYVPNYAK